MSCPASASAPVPIVAPVPADRWLEIDLYWFDSAHIDRSARAFWDRYAPLYRDVGGHRGIVLSVGLTANYIMAFSGHPDQSIALPKATGQELSVDIAGPLVGDTVARQKAWRARFATHDNAGAQVEYGAWTYAQLARLAAALRSQGASHGVTGFKVATLAVAGESAYGELSPFAIAHPEAWTRWGARAGPGFSDTNAYFDPAARLKADPAPLGGLPKGIVEGMPVHAAFAAQWGALSRKIGLDGLMLRDGFGFSRAYTRYGPWGKAVPDVATATAQTDALGTMLREIKQANPQALTMMYSTAATATADWRANGIDLERIAGEGNLDIFVDQTWAGAWGEAGVRQQTFWNAPILGWTYQLSYLLQHAAVLAKSRVHHYQLVETFDAWESWDIIHTAPDRLRWGIWAYSHAAVKTPHGLRMPEGSYISWANHGYTLLHPADVTTLRDTLNDAERDAAQVTDMFGPTMVYARDAAQWQMATAASGKSARDRIDETMGSLIKWPLPIASITRLEWLPKVSSDLFVFGATAGIGTEDRATLAAMAGHGQPMAFLAATTDTDPVAAQLAGVGFVPHAPPQEDASLSATRGDGPDLATRHVPATFEAVPTVMQTTARKGTSIYGFGGSAALVLRLDGGRNVSFWEPAMIDDAWFVPMRALMRGNPAPYALASATLNRQLARDDRLRADVTDLDQTGTVAAWRRKDGSISLLAGNLEEGLRDDADQSRTLSLALPHDWQDYRWRSAWSGGEVKNEPGQARIVLPQGGSMMIMGSR